MKVLFVENRHPNKIYYHYNSLYDGLVENKCEITKVNNINKINTNKFDIIIMGYGSCTDLHKISLKTNKPIIAFLFKLSCNTEEKFRFCQKNKNIHIFGSQHRIQEFNEKYNIDIKPTLYPFNPKIFYDRKLEKIYDIGISGAIHGSKHYKPTAYLESEKDIREKIINKIKNQKWRYFLKVSDSSAEASRILNHDEYAKTINQSKIWIATNADHGDLTPRYCEVIASKTLLFCNEQPYNTFKSIFRDGETCVFFKNDLSDFVEKVNYYLQNTEKYKKIVETAYKEFHDNYTIKKIVKKYLSYK